MTPRASACDRCGTTDSGAFGRETNFRLLQGHGTAVVVPPDAGFFGRLRIVRDAQRRRDEAANLVMRRMTSEHWHVVDLLHDPAVQHATSDRMDSEGLVLCRGCMTIVRADPDFN